MGQSDLPQPIRALLKEVGHEGEPPRTRRIFTNRDLDLDQIGAIGFDMDYTLALYRQDQLEAISMEVTIGKLIASGYPEKLREMEPDPAFAVRGLVVDRKLGNLLKMDRHGYVGRCYHGRNLLPRPERKGIYRAQRIGQERSRFAYVDTLFALPEVTIFAELVDMIDSTPEVFGDQLPSYDKAWLDVRTAIDQAHQDDSIKSRIKADPGRYIQFDPELPATLHKLRSAGKKLFLLTNSYFAYSNVVLDFLLGGKLEAYESWHAFFDWVVVGGKKPAFFTENQPFQELDRSGKPVGKPKPEPQKGKIYEGGNQAGLTRALGTEPDQVLYVGDHIYGDIVKSKKSSGWRTVLVVQDLEHELRVRMDYRVALHEIEVLTDLRDQLNEDISNHRHLQRGLGRLLPDHLVERHGLTYEAAQGMLGSVLGSARVRFDRLRTHESDVHDALQRRSAEVDAAFNRYWGSVFTERQDASMFGAQLENYACLYTSRVSNFLFVSPARYFHVPHGSMPHWG